VPATFIEQLVAARQYLCPHCSSHQGVALPPESAAQLVAQARAWGRHAAAAAAAHARYAPPPPPPAARAPLPPALAELAARINAAARGAPAAPDAAALAALLSATRPQARRVALPPAARPAPAAAAATPAAPPPPAEDVWAEEEPEEGAAVAGGGAAFAAYRPAKLGLGAEHPDAVVETASLAAVEPPDVRYALAAHAQLAAPGRLSALQLEAVVYACQRHEARLPSGETAGFFLGDGAGVGKGRTVAGLVAEAWARGRRRHLWVSVGADLKFDARRDLDDVGAADIEVHALNKLPYAKLAGAKVGVKEGVLFLTYSSLVAASDGGRSRFKQVVEWCGAGFDGLLVFDGELCMRPYNLLYYIFILFSNLCPSKPSLYPPRAPQNPTRRRTSSPRRAGARRRSASASRSSRRRSRPRASSTARRRAPRSRATWAI
jgi:hypothetical protein